MLHRALSVILLLCLSLASACGVGGSTSGSPEQPTPTEKERPILLVQANTITTRRLDAKAQVPWEFLDKQRFRAKYLELLEKYYSREEARQEALTLWLLRLIDDRDLDLYQLELDLASEGLAGFYIFEEKKMYLISEQDELDGPLKLILSHEFVHALQDQHFDLQRFFPPDRKDQDRDLAVRALIEGDATVSSVQYALDHLGTTDLYDVIHATAHISPEVAARAPNYISEIGYFPYDEGYTFVDNIRIEDHFGFGKINEVYSTPPSSTEQILHPEKYLQKPRDEPLPISMPPLTTTLGTGWTYKRSDTLGEFHLRVLLEEGYAVNPEEAAAGWGAGRFALYEKGESALLYVLTRWDSESDATEFDEAMRETLEYSERLGDLWSEEGRYFGLTRSGDQVVFISATDRASVELALKAAK